MEANADYVRRGFRLAAPPLPDATAAALSSPRQHAVTTAKVPRRTAPGRSSANAGLYLRTELKHRSNGNMENSAVAAVDSNG
ncbi:Os07g0675400 [Oryza sativa Japonica Group]|uniref:Os07g0675400 protein n=1 Tax=Oryza sativa subsp. japonica TaxID=39947 RepID=A0A0P0XAA5_ORYSJ|nr:hypothetical protein EE612_041371 [Oryza sativa]BAT03198.1 Os07g0675400 [Oryza sativa Japonica Group]